MKLIFIRHGQAESNILGAKSCRIYDNYPLTKAGREQIFKTAKSISERYDGRIDEVFASPVLRTRQSAEIIAKSLGISTGKIKFDERIKEIDFGDFNEKRGEISVELDEIFRAQIAGNLHIRMGYYGENNYEFQARLYRFLADISDRYTTENIVIVSHSSPIAVMEKALKKFLGDSNVRHHTVNGEIKEFELSHNDHAKIIHELTMLDNEIKNETYRG